MNSAIFYPIISDSLTVSNAANIRLAVPASNALLAQSRFSNQCSVRLVNEGPNPCYVRQGPDATVQASVPNGSGADITIVTNTPIYLKLLQDTTHISAICKGAETAVLRLGFGVGEG